MSFLTVLLTGLGLSMDAVAVSITSGLSPVPPRRRDALKMALCFGAMQAAMPAIGFLLGFAFRDWIAALDHWIAFLLLSAIGGKMIHEAFADEEEAEARVDRFSPKRLVLLGVATSIDALAVGVSFSLLEIGLAEAVAIIGVTTLALCYPAVLFGRRLGALVSKRAELFGGLLLVAIGLKILVEPTLLG
jgi:putative Mn2+ efflux pump MntP